MSNLKIIGVTPAPYIKPSINVSNVQIRVQNLVLFTSVNLNVTLMGSNNEYIDSKAFSLSGADYTNWTNDDTYIVNYVLTQLGLTQADALNTA